MAADVGVEERVALAEGCGGLFESFGGGGAVEVDDRGGEVAALAGAPHERFEGE
jgi:hypothetical protein